MILPHLFTSRPILSACAPCRALLLAAALLASSLAAGETLDVREWVSRPGVKLVAVEFYATWCKPCMDAVSRWKALHDKYRDQGLRLIVVSTRDPDGQCKNVGWTPDKQVCDLDGVVADSLRVGSNLPSAFLWSWQGNLLVQRGHVGEVEAAVAMYLGKNPRVAVEAADPAVEALVRSELGRSGKLTVVSGERELARLRALRKTTYDAAKADDQRCQLGQEVAPNSLLEAKLFGAGADRRLGLSLHSLESGCQSALVTVRYDAAQPERAVAEAMGGLLGQLLQQPSMPGAKAGTAPVRKLQGAPEVPRGGIDVGDLEQLKQAQALADALQAAERIGADKTASAEDKAQAWERVAAVQLKSGNPYAAKAAETAAKIRADAEAAALTAAVDAAERTNGDASATPEAKAAAWERVAAVVVKAGNPYVAKARENAAAWRAIAAARPQMAKDAEGLAQLATLTVVSKDDKLKKLDEFLTRYAALSGEADYAATKSLRDRVVRGEVFATPAPVPPSRTDLYKTEVTVAQYRECVRAGKCMAPDLFRASCNYQHADRGEHPVNCVDWHQATAYCAYADARLPTEEEWMAGFTNGGTTQFPWGNEAPACARAVIGEGSLGCGQERTWPVCSKPSGSNTRGICDLAGNLSEWTSTQRGSGRIIRGGGWSGSAPTVRFRYDYGPSYRSYDVGFRCTRP